MSLMENGYLFTACYHFADQQKRDVIGVNVTSLLLKSIVQSFFYKEIRHFKRDYWF